MLLLQHLQEPLEYPVFTMEEEGGSVSEWVWLTGRVPGVALAWASPSWLSW